MVEKNLKSDSVTSLGFSEDLEDGEVQPDICSGPLPYGQFLYNVCVFAIKCQHKKMPLILLKDRNAFWLPYLAVSEGQKWCDSRLEMELQFIQDQTISEEEMLAATKGFIKSIQLVSLSRLQLPSEDFIKRVVFCAEWKAKPESKVVCCKDTNKFKWYPIDDIINGKIGETLWGKEVLEFGFILNKSKEELQSEPILSKEVINKEIYRFLKYSNESKIQKDRVIAQTIKETKVNKRIVEKLYSDFVQHCYPSFYMSFISFKRYMNQMELKRVTESITERVFIAFNYEKNGFLTFDEFFLGLIALEPASPQNHLRNEYILRFYDSDSDGILDRKDIYEMASDMKKYQKISYDNQSVDELVDKIMNIPDICDKQNKITFEAFLSKVDSQELKDVSVLFRSLESLHKIISDKNIYEPIGKRKKMTTYQLNKFCPKHRTKDFKFAIHSVSMGRNGRNTDPKDIRYTDGRDITFEEENEFVETQRKHSIEIINNYKSIPNYIIEVIRELVKILNKPDVNSQTKTSFKMSTNEKISSKHIEIICKEIREIFKNESRVLKIQSPIVVLGDIHGNLRDLLIFEEQFWRSAPQSLSSNILFAGDYVDRGEFGIECVLYLYSLKILNPSQFFLLRGNHEIRAVQKHFTFEKECKEKYKDKGPLVFETINTTFDVLPIAAVIDETLFCVHGGIPYSRRTIEELMKIPVEIKEPEIECPAVWEILWSDPLNKEDYENIVKFNNIKDDIGYINNTKRSTAFYFSEKALNAFLTTNQLSHVIRAHEVIEDGYKLFLDGKVITVFSSSGYCGMRNKAAAIHISGQENEGIIKIIVLESSISGSK